MPNNFYPKDKLDSLFDKEYEITFQKRQIRPKRELNFPINITQNEILFLSGVIVELEAFGLVSFSDDGTTIHFDLVTKHGDIDTKINRSLITTYGADITRFCNEVL